MTSHDQRGKTETSVVEPPSCSFFRTRSAATHSGIQRRIGHRMRRRHYPIMSPNSTRTESDAVPWARIAAVLLVALVAAIAAYDTTLRHPIYRDFDQIGFAARALLDGRNPYEEIGPGRAYDWNGFYYPLTAPVAVLPLAWLPRAWLNAVVTFAGAGLFGWVLTRRSLGALVFFVSMPAVFAALLVQWSWLLAAAVGIPAIGVLFAAKPTIGFAMFVARPSWWPFAGGAVLLAVAFLLQPGWIADWRAELASTTITGGIAAAVPYLAPVARPGGVLVLLALCRWRRPEARLLAALACVPQTPYLYEAVPLFLVASGTPQVALLTALSWLAWGIMETGEPFASVAARYEYQSNVIVWCLYLPALALVLGRPNIGSAPDWLERALLRLRAPKWLQGSNESAADELRSP
jgi:hypothetical protein